LPAAVGVKVTVIVHVAPGATLDPQLEVAVAKSPEAAMLLMRSGPLPVLLRVAVCACALVVPNGWGVAKVKLAGARPAMGAVAPVPLSAIVCGLLAALSARVIKPVARPPVVGVEVTLTVQVPWGSTETQVLACANGPVAEIVPKLRVAVPELVTVRT